METINKNKKTKITFVLVGLVATIVLTDARNARADTWTQKADMPTARMARTHVVDGKIYAIGGLAASTTKRVEAYDPATDTWAAKADIPTQRTFTGSSVVDGKIYVIGGVTFWGGPTLATVEAYDPVTDTWTRKADMPAPRGELTSFAVNGKIYAIGGMYFSGSREVSTVEMYDPATDTWTRRRDMPTARAFSSTAVVDGQIYVIGGQPAGAGAQPALSTVEVYDPVTDTWTRKRDMLSLLSGMGTCVLNGKIYCFGGRPNTHGGPTSTVFEYDPVTDIWTVKGDMPVPNHDMGVNTVDGRIYLIGGSSALFPYTEVLSTVWEYIPSPDLDFNGDGVVDARDMSMMVEYWHTDEPLYDIAPPPSGDGIVDVQDLILLSEHLFEENFPPGLLAYWKLDETEGDTAHDSIEGNDGFGPSDLLWRPEDGKVGGALELDGIDDSIVTTFSLNPVQTTFSAFAWIKGGGPEQVALSQNDGVNWLLADSEGQLMTDLRRGSSGPRLTSEYVITDGDWHRIGLVWDKSHRHLYADGIEVAEDTNNVGYLGSSNGNLCIGCGNSFDANSFFLGLIDDVRIYNEVLSAEKIAAMSQ